MQKKPLTPPSREIDWPITLVPLGIILAISLLLFLFPARANALLDLLRDFFVNKLGFFYILLGLGMLLTALILAFSRHGQIRLGDTEKPLYGNFRWGAMIFTSTMAADILYWSLIEWCYYYQSAPFAAASMTLSQKQDMASAYPLFHWGPIPWAFYILPACAYAYMMYVKKRKRQTLSEACRPILHNWTDRLPGRAIDIFSIVGLLAGCATTFSVVTPLLSQIVSSFTGMPASSITSIAILLVIGATFIIAVMKGMKAISHLASICVIIFCILLGTFLLCGPKIYIIETGVTAIGTVLNDFFRMATWMDPLRLSGTGSTGFPQDWTIFYWAYWIAWFVATPFFIARISKGRTIRGTILGGLSCGLLGTYTSFIVFGGYGLHLQTTKGLDLAGSLASGAAPAEVILQIFDTFPIPKLVLFILCLAMIAFYASTFDAITLVVAGNSEKSLHDGQEPRKRLRAYWAAVFLLLPIGLLFSESTLANLKTISIIAAFPLGLIMLLVVVGFIKELKNQP